jgi:hypothetical protein
MRPLLLALVLIVAVLAIAASTTPAAAPASAPAGAPATSASRPVPVGQGTLKDSAGKPPFVFVVIGGVTHDSPEPMPAYVEAVKWVNSLNPDFSVNVGDNVEGVRAVPREWDTFVKTSADLAAPCYLIAGNHDMQKFAAEWDRRFGPRYHSFVHKGVQLVFLCADEPAAMGKLSDEQVAWLMETLKTPATSRFVFCHEGFWREGSKEMKELWSQKIEPAMAAAGVRAVFGGHHAIYEMRTSGPIRYYVTQGGGMHGTTGKGATPPAKGGFQHVLKVAVAADGSATVTLFDGKQEQPDTIGLVTPKATASKPASKPATAPGT